MLQESRSLTSDVQLDMARTRLRAPVAPGDDAMWRDKGSDMFKGNAAHVPASTGAIAHTEVAREMCFVHLLMV